MNERGFANRDLNGIDAYQIRTQANIAFTTQFPAITVVGTPTYTMRWRDVGKACQFEVEFKSSTTIASTAGVSYFQLPMLPYDPNSLQPFGKGGMAQMNNISTNIAVGLCSINLANGRCYLPTQAASANTFQVSGWYPIG